MGMSRTWPKVCYLVPTRQARTVFSAIRNLTLEMGLCLREVRNGVNLLNIIIKFWRSCTEFHVYEHALKTVTQTKFGRWLCLCV